MRDERKQNALACREPDFVGNQDGIDRMIRRSFDQAGFPFFKQIRALIGSDPELSARVGFERENLASWLPLYAWMTLTAVVGSWVVLLISKFWESSSGDQALRRWREL